MHLLDFRSTTTHRQNDLQTEIETQKRNYINDENEAEDSPSTSSKANLVVFNNLDALSREDPKFCDWHDWLVVNVLGCKLQNGDVLSAFIGSGPPKDTVTLRFLDGRGGFKIAEFAKKYELGTRVAGNFFQAEYDDYVPKLYEKLGIKTEPPKDPKAKGAKAAENPKETKAEAPKEEDEKAATP
uniref:Uncharacterized protein n=1 Tax=Glossina austeni TaxID=7395 RepID=A0A1A9UNP8_GLOAU